MTQLIEISEIYSAFTGYDYNFEPPLVFELGEPFEVDNHPFGTDQLWDVKLLGTTWEDTQSENIYKELRYCPLFQYIHDDPEILEENAKQLRQFLLDRLQGTYQETERPKSELNTN